MIGQLALSIGITFLMAPFILAGSMVGAYLTCLALWPFIWLGRGVWWLCRALRYAFRNEPIEGVK